MGNYLYNNEGFNGGSNAMFDYRVYNKIAAYRTSLIGGRSFISNVR